MTAPPVDLEVVAPGPRRRLPRAFWILWAGMLINRLAGFVVPFLALYLTGERGFSRQRAGAFVSLHGLGMCVAGLAGGWLADRWGRRRTILLGLAGGACAAIGLGLTRSPWAIAPLVLTVGLLGELYRPAVQAAVADVVSPADRAYAFGLLYWCVNLAFTVSMLLAGVLTGNTYQLLFLIDGGTTLVFAALIAVSFRETRPVELPSAPAVSPFVALRDRQLVEIVLLNVAVGLVFAQFLVALPLDMVAKHIPPSGYAFLISINGAVIILLQPPAAGLLAAVPRRRVLAAAALLIGAGFGLHALARSSATYAVAIVVWTLGEIAYLPTVTALVADLAPLHLRGRYQGTLAFGWSLAGFAAPFVGTAVLEHAGPAVLWGGCLVVGAAVAAAHFARSPRTKPLR